MNKVGTISGVAAPLPLDNVDTDVIIRIEKLAQCPREELGRWGFAPLRFRPDGAENPDFVLNQPAWRAAPILVAGRNFGCGSSREHAVWALEDFGFKAVVAPSFADIFYANCTKIGVLPVVLPEEEVRALMQAREATVDLERQVVCFGGRDVPFEINPDIRERLLNGLDDIALTLEHAGEIERFERERPETGSFTTAI